jgi:hypothetical protein
LKGSNPRRYFFVHIHKAAGTALWRRLQRHFAPRAMYPHATDGDPRIEAPQLSVGQLLDRWRERGSEIEIVAGHFPYCTTELLDGDFVTISVLREPVERVLSHLRRRRRTEAAARDAALEDIYAETMGNYRNHMVKMFSLTADEIAGSAENREWAMLAPIDFTPEHLERAKRNVAQVDVLGLQHRFEEFCDELQLRFGWQLGVSIRTNVTEPEPVTDELRRQIATDNAMDVELFDYARELYERRHP